MDPSSDRAARSEEVWALAEKQHGVVSRRQLLDLGLNHDAVRHRLGRGRLHRVARGTYAVGRPELTRHGRWMAAVLAIGPGALLSHGSAAALWGIGREWRWIEVTVRTAAPRRGDGIRVRRRPTLAERNVTERDGVPVTGIVQTLVDLAAVHRKPALDRAVNEADRLDLVHPPELRRALEVHRCEPGVRALRELLDQRTFRLKRSELEGVFLPLCERAGLPLPLTKQHVNGFEVDFHWPDLDFVVESDGLRYHRTPSEQARDRLRDQTHTAAGTTNLRFTHEQIHYEPDHVLAVLRRTAKRLPVPAPIGP